MNTYKVKLLDSEFANYTMSVLVNGLNWTTFALAPKSRLVCGPIHFGSTRSEADLVLLQLIEMLQIQCHRKVVGIFVNYYRDGKDYCPYHRDTYGLDTYTLSLGASRDFLLKPDNGGATIKVKLDPGDLYYMPNSVHLTHKHSIPKRAGAGPRVSILFFVA